MPDSPEPTGRIVRTDKDGKPILWTFVPEMPCEEEKRSRPWLTVLSWHYDGSGNNGMPDADANRRMLDLDEALGTLERLRSFTEAYRRIGCDLREFVLYVEDRDDFLASLNKALADHPKYPIEIKFYEDENWSDLEKLINDFNEV